MAGDKWTFLVVRDEGGPVRQYSFTTRLLKVMGGIGAAVALVLAVVTLIVGVNSSARIKAQRLEAQNDALRAEIEQFQFRVGQLELTLGGLAQEGSNLRTLAGLETFDPDESFAQAPATNEVEPSSDAVIDGDLVDTPADRPTGPPLRAHRRLDRRPHGLVSCGRLEVTGRVVRHLGNAERKDLPTLGLVDHLAGGQVDR